MRPRGGESMLSRLLAEGRTCAPDDLPDLVARTAARACLHDAAIYLADLQREKLHPMPRGLEPLPGDSLGIDTSLAGRAFRNTEPVTAPPNGNDTGPGGQTLWLPLLDGTERLGVLRVRMAADDDELRYQAERLADLTSMLIVCKRAHSDTYARLTRLRRMSLAAQVQWTVMPVPALVTEQVSISGVLEPAYEVGGDAFDFAMSGPIAHLAVFDAMGHDLASSLIATIAMASSRNRRLSRAEPIAIAEAIDEAVGDQYQQSRFVTGILGDLDTRTGELNLIVRGHPPPLLIRRGRTVMEVDCPAGPPMGIGLDVSGTPPHRVQLEPGDRLLLYTDGITDARAPDGTLFGLERFTDFVIRGESAGLSTPETLRRLVHEILRHHNGELRDDATALLAEWHPHDGTADGFDAAPPPR